MKKNVGGVDRVLRIVVGLAAIAWGVYAQNWWGAIGVIPLFTAIIGWCPAYLPFGISSCKTGN
jgi:type IV secretory pathway TrbD component